MKSYLFYVLFALLIIPIVHAQPVKRLYIANDDHTDYMWTADEARYDSAFVKMLDYYLDQIDVTRKRPDDQQTRFNCDGSIWVKAYRKYRNDAQYQKLIQAIRSGHISVPLNYLVSTFGAQPTEAVLRGMYYSGQLERESDLRLPLAIAMENQTLPLGLSSLWAGSGAKYSWKGVCNCATRIGKNLGSRQHQLYHYQGTDGQSVLMKWYNRAPGSIALGGYAEARTEEKISNSYKDISGVVSTIDKMCDTISSTSKYPYNVAGAFGYGWDDLSTFIPVFPQIAEQHSTPERRVRVSNGIDFFEDIERSYKNLPSETLTYGNEWDLYCASMNETTAQVRRATEKLRTAESLATLVSLKNNAFLNDLKKSKDEAWDAFGLYWEHDWTADGPVKREARAAWQIKQKNYITNYVDSLYQKSVRGLGQLIPAASSPRFYVYNSLSWARSDVADLGYDGTVPMRVIDITSGKEVLSQLVLKDGKRYIRIWAENIPSVGYKVFELRSGSTQKVKQAATFQNGILKNEYYEIKITKSGVITEILDRKSGRQLVKQQHGRYFNDLGTKNLDLGELQKESSGPVSVTIRAISSDPVPHVVKITVYAKNNRIDIEDSITANFSDVKTWAFSLNLRRPSTQYEELGSILTAKKESEGGNYANQNARYDWQTFNHFASLSEKNYSISISNLDCNFFRLGQSTPDSLWSSSAQLHALAGGQIDKNLGIFKQNGETDFRYHFSISANVGAFNAKGAMRTALAHQNPLTAAPVTGKVFAGAYPEKAYSFLKLSSPDVFLWSLKPSEAGIGNGVIARLWNLDSKNISSTISTSLAVKQAWETSHIETDKNQIKESKGTIEADLKGSQIKTYRMILK